MVKLFCDKCGREVPIQPISVMQGSRDPQQRSLNEVTFRPFNGPMVPNLFVCDECNVHILRAAFPTKGGNGLKDILERLVSGK